MKRLAFKIPATMIGMCVVAALTTAAFLDSGARKTTANDATAGKTSALEGFGTFIFLELLLVAILSGIAILASRRVTSPISALTEAMKEIGAGNYDVDMPLSTRADELGQMQQTLRTFRDDLAVASKQHEEVMFKGQAFENTMSAMIMVDTSGIIKYMNNATKQMFDEHRETFKNRFASFDPDNMIGHSFDQFHETPAHQQSIISDPSRLPYRTSITIDKLRFSMNVSGIFDPKGKHVGCILEWQEISELAEKADIIKSLETSMARIDFTPDGIITDANEIFLNAMGYQLNEIVGKHHRIFMPKDQVNTQEYAKFWENLRSGETFASKIHRVTKAGESVWLDATYNALIDEKGRVYKVMKLASDVSEAEKARLQSEELRRGREQDAKHVISVLEQSLQSLAEGDLTTEISSQFPETFEELRLNYNNALSKLRATMSDLIQNAHRIRTGVSKISGAADDLSVRTVNQKKVLGSTATSLDNLTQIVQAVAESTATANDAGTMAKQKAETSEEVVRQVVTSMNEIQESSLKISKVTSLINEIAFQTNLLALNAGVEAARAGDTGRGFSVVASEVRGLAIRASEAAREIDLIISSSSKQVERGVELVGQAGTALSEIVSTAMDISSRISEIASSTEAQSDGISGINISMVDMNEVTQQNSAMVEETTMDSKKLDQEAEHLIEIISQFKTDRHPERAGHTTSGRDFTAAA